MGQSRPRPRSCLGHLDLPSALPPHKDHSDLGHRHLGVPFKLCHLPDNAPGMVFWHPRGYVLYRVLEDCRHHFNRADIDTAPALATPEGCQ